MQFSILDRKVCREEDCRETGEIKKHSTFVLYFTGVSVQAACMLLMLSHEQHYNLSLCKELNH